MAYEFILTTELTAEPQVVYDAWMSSEGHTAMTGGIAHIIPAVGAAFDAWDGYINGKTIELEHGRCIRQSWRTNHFSINDPDSIIEMTLSACDDGTLLTLKHSNVPEGQTSYEKTGWNQHYFEPMKRRFEWLRLRATI